jgi:hypothetical protein
MSEIPEITPRWISEEAAQSRDAVQPPDVYEPKLIWIAKYKDGRQLAQFKDDVEISVNDIDRKNLLSIRLVDRQGRVIISQEYRKGQIPIIRKRSAMRANKIYEVVHILGWLENYNTDLGVISAEHVCFVYESNMRIEMGRFRQQGEKHQSEEEWQYPINYRDIDQIPVE